MEIDEGVKTWLREKGRFVELYVFRTQASLARFTPFVTDSIPIDTRKKVCASFW